MSLFNENPKSIFTNIKELLKLGSSNRHHAFHTPVFSNKNQNNSVDSRVVVLRKFDKDNLKLNFSTDFRSSKIINLKRNNNSSFVFYDFKLKIQLRIKTLSIINNKNDISKNAWKLTRLSSRKCYLTEKAPSSVTTLPNDGIPEYLKGIDPSHEESEKGYNNFTVIENEIQCIDWLYLAASGHRRLKIDFKNSEPLFEWIIP
jgi:3-hydroxyisobutyrate dehydrogenase